MRIRMLLVYDQLKACHPNASGVYMCTMRQFPFRSYPNSTKVLHVLLTNSKSSGLSRALFRPLLQMKDAMAKGDRKVEKAA